MAQTHEKSGKKSVGKCQTEFFTAFVPNLSKSHLQYSVIHIGKDEASRFQNVPPCPTLDVGLRWLDRPWHTMTMTQICAFWQMSHDVAPRLTLDWLQP
jgi:hypothetical protein